MRIFYSCLYRVFLYPRKAYELDPAQNPVHYVPSTGGVKAGVRYTDSCFWDIKNWWRNISTGHKITKISLMPQADLCVAKTEYWVKKLLEEAFTPHDDGYPGDEDTGTTSAWYILASLGIYRLCPGKDEWIRFEPSVKNALILGRPFDYLTQ